MRSICTYKLSQDHLELWFCAVRSRLGANNNPSCREFTNIFKRLLVKHEISSNKGNCISQDSTVILFTRNQTKATEQEIHAQDMSTLKRLDMLDHRAPQESDHDYVDMEPQMPSTSFFKMSCISYISGYVIRMIMRTNTCEPCLSALTTKQPSREHSLIVKKHLEACCTPQKMWS